jgi:hypothetical protein
VLFLAVSRVAAGERFVDPSLSEAMALASIALGRR